MESRVARTVPGGLSWSPSTDDVGVAGYGIYHRRRDATGHRHHGYQLHRRDRFPRHDLHAHRRRLRRRGQAEWPVRPRAGQSASRPVGHRRCSRRKRAVPTDEPHHLDHDQSRRSSHQQPVPDDVEHVWSVQRSACPQRRRDRRGRQHGHEHRSGRHRGEHRAQRTDRQPGDAGDRRRILGAVAAITISYALPANFLGKPGQRVSWWPASVSTSNVRRRGRARGPARSDRPRPRPPRGPRPGDLRAATGWRRRPRACPRRTPPP
jgi:hypothetical protein